jgi:hypothetical protein
MANTAQNNVIKVDTTAYTNSNPLKIAAIKYIGNTSGTAAITAGTSGSGASLWVESGTANQCNEVSINAADGIHVALTNGAQVYIYLK